MAREQSQSDNNASRTTGELFVHRSADGNGAAGEQRSLGELFKQLTNDSGDLVRQEVALIKAEVKQAGSTLAGDATKVGMAVGLAFNGALALTAFLIIGLGGLLEGKYWLSALIIGALFLLIGGMMASNAVADVKKRGLTPERTMNTLRDDAVWARQEAGEVKRELTT